MGVLRGVRKGHFWSFLVRKGALHGDYEPLLTLLPVLARNPPSRSLAAFSHPEGREASPLPWPLFLIKPLRNVENVPDSQRRREEERKGVPFSKRSKRAIISKSLTILVSFGLF